MWAFFQEAFFKRRGTNIKNNIKLGTGHGEEGGGVLKFRQVEKLWPGGESI